MPVAPARRRSFVLLGGTLLVLALLTVVQPAAHAACHIAAFVETSVEAAAGDGEVTLTVELQGRQPACEGSVDFSTQDGSASAGADYEAASGTLTFEANDDRVEEVTITIADDASSGDFRVVLDNPTGSISGTGDPAVVTISGSATDPDPTEAETVQDDPTTQPDAPSEVPTEDGDDAGAGLPWIPLLVVVIILGLLVAWYIARRTPDRPVD